MKTTIIVTSVAAALVPPATQAQLVVAAPGVEARQDHKNIFDALKYAWEQTQWADKLATLHSTLTTVQQHLETANLVKQAIGDPVAAIALIDNGLFSEYLQDSGIGETLGELIDITREGVELSATVQELFSPIDMSGWKNLSGDMTATFDGMASFRDSSDPLKRFRAVENAYSRFEILIGRAQNKRRVLNQQIARLNTQLKGAKDDAEVQKLVGSLETAQAALDRPRLHFGIGGARGGNAPHAQREPPGRGGGCRRGNQQGAQP